MITLDTFSGICNSVDDLFTKTHVLNKTKSKIVKTLNMITRIYEAKKLIKHFMGL